ncbi:hypothetical protein [Chryseobacterium indoltheticum]|uniref:hypothetical protein n=1 Tax=Chryseobacterium indoltheticum TaxID=254 RepID=UPI003F495C7A
MKKTLSLILGLSIVLSTTSCASIFTGTKDSIAFTSTPEGAKVIHKGKKNVQHRVRQKFREVWVNRW